MKLLQRGIIIFLAYFLAALLVGCQRFKEEAADDCFWTRQDMPGMGYQLIRVCLTPEELEHLDRGGKIAYDPATGDVQVLQGEAHE